MDVKQFNLLIATIQEVTGALFEISEKIVTEERKPGVSIVNSLDKVANAIIAAPE